MCERARVSPGVVDARGVRSGGGAGGGWRGGARAAGAPAADKRQSSAQRRPALLATPRTQNKPTPLATLTHLYISPWELIHKLAQITDGSPSTRTNSNERSLFYSGNAQYDACSMPMKLSEEKSRF